MNDIIQRAAAAIDTRRVVDLARTLCAVPSDPTGEGPRAEFIAETLDRDGVEVHIADVVEGRPNVIAKVSGDR